MFFTIIFSYQNHRMGIFFKSRHSPSLHASVQTQMAFPLQQSYFTINLTTYYFDLRLSNITCEHRLHCHLGAVRAAFFPMKFTPALVHIRHGDLSAMSPTLHITICLEAQVLAHLSECLLFPTLPHGELFSRSQQWPHALFNHLMAAVVMKKGLLSLQTAGQPQPLEAQLLGKGLRYMKVPTLKMTQSLSEKGNIVCLTSLLVFASISLGRTFCGSSCEGSIQACAFPPVYSYSLFVQYLSQHKCLLLFGAFPSARLLL